MATQKTRTLVIILNHNLPEYTDRLYMALKEYQDETYDLKVMDNGSAPEYLPNAIHIRLEKNLYWGGALNEAFKIVLNNDRYDSLLFLNNDIEVTAEVFVKLLRMELFSGNLAIVSPCIAGSAQPWKQMQNWGGGTRIVRWADLQSPLFHRRFIEVVQQFDPELYYGWGQELLCSEICQDHGWEIGVCDHISILHFGNQTLLQKRLFVDQSPENPEKKEVVSLADSHGQAWRAYQAYFLNHPLKYSSFEEMCDYGETYTFNECFSALKRGSDNQDPEMIKKISAEISGTNLEPKPDTTKIRHATTEYIRFLINHPEADEKHPYLRVIDAIKQYKRVIYPDSPQWDIGTLLLLMEVIHSTKIQNTGLKDINEQLGRRMSEAQALLNQNSELLAQKIYELKNINEELIKKDTILNLVINSFSFKIGHTLLWPFKKILGR